MLTNSAISSSFFELQEELESAQILPISSPCAALIKHGLEGLSAPFTNNTRLIACVQHALRAVFILKAGLHTNEDFFDSLGRLSLPSWENFPDLEADNSLQKSLAERLFNVPDHFPSPYVLLSIGAGAGLIAGHIIDKLRARNIPFVLDTSDMGFQRLVINHADEEGLRALAAFKVAIGEKVTHKIIALPHSTPPIALSKETKKHDFFEKELEPLTKKSRSGSVMYTLTYFPTAMDAALDDIPLDRYIALHFEMADQPDLAIRHAHDHLINILNKTKTLRFTNADGTDISMDLVDEKGKHFTFCNSQTQRNIPGSEVFSAPRKNSVHGKIVARGKFSPAHDSEKIIMNLVMEFAEGRLFSFSADSGADYFQAYLDRHENNGYVGEIGIGTNPHLKRHVLNGLLVEKIGGSFHIALGGCYTMTDYMGTPVHVDNGNHARDHWDITTMLYGRGGRIYADDTLIMDNGSFIDSALDVLNRGWNAIPKEDRPSRWKDYKGAFTGE